MINPKIDRAASDQLTYPTFQGHPGVLVFGRPVPIPTVGTTGALCFGTFRANSDPTTLVPWHFAQFEVRGNVGIV